VCIIIKLTSNLAIRRSSKPVELLLLPLQFVQLVGILEVSQHVTLAIYIEHNETRIDRLFLTQSKVSTVGDGSDLGVHVESHVLYHSEHEQGTSRGGFCRMKNVQITGVQID
jgi:hypothetical protein